MLMDDEHREEAGVTGIVIAHLGAFGSGELKTDSGGNADLLPLWDVTCV